MSQDVQTIRISEYVRLDKRQRSAKWQARVKLADGFGHVQHRFADQEGYSISAFSYYEKSTN